jgi:Tfp pilus assembly protein PilX
MSHYIQQSKQSGAVSLFVVIFAALLMTIVTVGFIQLMLKDQQQATTSDLSQSAYDSAQAGVEDAKRLLLLEQSCRNGTAASTINCVAIASALTPVPGQSETTCDTISRAGLVSETNNETIIQKSDSDSVSDKLDQAYTCVKVGVNTDDYKGQVDVNQSDMVSLAGVSSFDSVELSWFSREDVSTSTTDPTIGFPTASGDVNLPPVGAKWQENYPALMRTQLMQMGTGFKLSDFDDSQADNKSNANTMFLYPSNIGATDKDFALDARRGPLSAPQQVDCIESFVDGEYACKITLKLPNPIDGNIAQRNAYLRLSALYNGAHYSLRLKNGTEYVKFNGVQPEVDSTGRANDMFRRVKARVELRGDFSYPEAAIDMQGNLCKNFTITDAEAGYVGTTTCDPLEVVN